MVSTSFKRKAVEASSQKGVDFARLQGHTLTSMQLNDFGRKLTDRGV